MRATSGYQGPFQPEWLEPARPFDILVRMLNNLRHAYMQQRRWPQAVAVIEYLHLAQPDVPQHGRDLGLAHYQNGAMHLALHYWNTYLQQSPEAADAVPVREAMRRLLHEWAPLN